MSTDAVPSPPASGEPRGSARPPSAARRWTRSRVEPAKASIDAHRLGLRLEEGGSEVADAFQTEAPHAGLVAPEIRVGAIGRWVERDRLPFHFLDHRPWRPHVFNGHAGTPSAPAGFHETELRGRSLGILQGGPSVE